jgi:hypothetical protein
VLPNREFSRLDVIAVFVLSHSPLHGTQFRLADGDESEPVCRANEQRLVPEDCVSAAEILDWQRAPQ